MIYKLSILGCGNMCSSILTGTLRKKIFEKKDIVIKNNSLKSSQIVAQNFGVAASENQKDIETATFVMLGIKPQTLNTVALAVFDTTVIISVLAGVTTKMLSQKFKTNNIVRVMPNMAAAINEGLAGVFFTNSIQTNQKIKVLDILNASGKTVVLKNENQMNRFTVLSGSLIGIIGFWEHNFKNFFQPQTQKILHEILYILAAEKFFSQKNAQKIIDQTFLGYKKMRTETKIPAQEMQIKVSSKNGVTESMTNFLTTNEIQKTQENFFNQPTKNKEIMQKIVQKMFEIGEKRAEELALNC